MRKCTFLFFLIALFGFNTGLQAQQDGAAYGGIQATPKSAWEVGLHGGHFFSAGDIDFKPSYAFGMHFRKALDYIFSLRIDATYGMARGDSGDAATGGAEFKGDYYTHKTTFGSLNMQGVLTLNNLRWDTPKRKMNFYFFAGAGPVYSVTEITLKNRGEVFEDFIYSDGTSANEISAGIELGAGLSFHISDKFNLGFEHKGATVFGRRTDLLDGKDQRWRDIINYTNLRFNFNLLNKGKLAEPLYWINPLDVVLNEVSELKARPVFDLTDTDKDGVIDILDQDKNSPPGAPVDTRGVPLDSDDDGIADYLDKEPYSPPGISVNGEGVAEKPSVSYVTRQDVDILIENALSNQGGSGTTVVDAFLPMVHFGVDSYTVRYADYGNLKSVANILKSNPGTKVVVRGFTDRTASDSYNQVLSYKRAQNAIDHLVSNLGVSANQLILQYGGEDESLVPASGSSFMNRRVEFHLAKPGDSNMPAPKGAGINKEAFDGNKKDGY